MKSEVVTREIADLTTVRDAEIPANVKFRQVLVTGPPASGKSTLVAMLGGWPEEGYLDLGCEWWRDRMLTLRPREVHLGVPFVGFSQSMAVSDPEWMESFPAPDLDRIQIPPEKRGLLSTNWRARYVFDFQLPRAEALFEVRCVRAKAGTHYRDAGATLEQATRQLDVYWDVARHLTRCGVGVYVRTEPGGRPREFAESGDPSAVNELSGSTG
jgi:energy-coupling factor transporter ATP-binding protein EcfA2